MAIKSFFIEITRLAQLGDEGVIVVYADTLDVPR